MNQADATERAIHAVQEVAFAFADEVLKGAPKGANRMDVSKIVVLNVASIALSIVLTGNEFGVFRGHDGEELSRADIINMALAQNGAPYRLVPLQ